MRNALTLFVTILAIVLLFTSLANPGPATAQTAGTPTPLPTTAPDDDSGVQDLPPLEGKLNPPRYPKMDSHLNRIVEQVQTGQSTAQAAAASAPIHREESVAVTLYVTEGYAQDVWDWLEESGGDPRNIGIDYVEAYVPVPLLPQASQQEGVIIIGTIVPPQTTQRALVSEGTTLHGATAWHEAGFKGQGVKIGIIDSGFEGFQSLMGTELPTSVQARCYTDIGVFSSNLVDCYRADISDDHHGTATTELVFDIAPDATYYIASWYITKATLGDLQNAVKWMVEQGVDVINMSLAFGLQGPGDGTIPWSNSPLRTVDIAVEGGILWANSAGNAGEGVVWFGGYSDSDSDGWIEFSGDDETNQIYREAGDPVYAVLRWDDDGWRDISKIADLDLDICLLTNEGEIVECSQVRNPPFSPFESMYYKVTQDGNYNLAVRVVRSGSNVPRWIQLLAYGMEYNTEHYSILSPSDSRNSGFLAVGAAPWWDPHSIAPYSSRGPATDDRTKPDITGAAGVSSSVYEDGFGGTSASSPYVAGLAALVKQRFPQYSPQRIAQYLKDNAEPRPTNDPVLGPSAHPNNTWGYGFARLPPPRWDVARDKIQAHRYC